MFHFTRKTQEFHMDYMTFKRSQYEYHLLPYKCLACIELPAIHESASGMTVPIAAQILLQIVIFLTVFLMSHTAKIIAKIIRRRIERKIEAVLGEDHFGFRRGKGTRDAIGMMRIIAE